MGWCESKSSWGFEFCPVNTGEGSTYKRKALLCVSPHFWPCHPYGPGEAVSLLLTSFSPLLDMETWQQSHGNTYQKKMGLICQPRGEGISPKSKVKVQGINWESWNCLSLVTPSCCGIKTCALLLFHRVSTMRSAGWEWRLALPWPSERVQKLSSPCSFWELASEKQFSQMCLGNCSPNDSEISSFRQKMIGILMQHGENIPLLLASTL